MTNTATKFSDTMSFMKSCYCNIAKARAGDGAGYAILEGNEIDLAMELGKYNPYFDFETHMVLSADQQMEIIKKRIQNTPK